MFVSVNRVQYLKNHSNQIAGYLSSDVRRRPRRSTHGHNCGGVDEDNMQVQVQVQVQAAADQEQGNLPEGVYAKGTVLKLTCNPGYELNIPKKKVKTTATFLYRLKLQ